MFSLKLSFLILLLVVGQWVVQGKDSEKLLSDLELDDFEETVPKISRSYVFGGDGSLQVDNDEIKIAPRRPVRPKNRRVHDGYAFDKTECEARQLLDGGKRRSTYGAGRYPYPYAYPQQQPQQFPMQQQGQQPQGQQVQVQQPQGQQLQMQQPQVQQTQMQQPQILHKQLLPGQEQMQNQQMQGQEAQRKQSGGQPFFGQLPGQQLPMQQQPQGQQLQPQQQQQLQGQQFQTQQPQGQLPAGTPLLGQQPLQGQGQPQEQPKRRQELQLQAQITPPQTIPGSFVDRAMPIFYKLLDSLTNRVGQRKTVRFQPYGELERLNDIVNGLKTLSNEEN